MNAPRLHDSLHESLDAALARALQAQDRLLERASRLVDLDDLRAGASTNLGAAVADRDAALRGLGGAVLAWVRSGGGIELVEVEQAPSDEAALGARANGPDLDGPTHPAPTGEPGVAPASPTGDLPSDPSDDGAVREERAAPTAMPGPAGPTPEPDAIPAPASPADVAALADRWGEGGALTPETRPPRSPLDRLGPMPDISTPRARKRELSRLLTEARRREGWLQLPATTQRALVRHMAARARDLQTRHGASLGKAQRRELDAVFSELTRFQSTAQPGFVHGLGRGHEPQHGTWLADAIAALRELDGPTRSREDSLLDDVEAAIARGDESRVVEALDGAVKGGVSSRDSRLLTLAAPFRAALEATGKCKTLRKALATQDAPATAGGGGDATADVRAAGDVLAHTEGKRALIVGGDRIGRSARRLEQALGMAQLDWQSGRKSRKVSSHRKRVQAGTYDIVIFVRRFLSHKVTDILLPALDDAPDTLVAWCDRGCGLPAVERAIRDATSDAPRAR